MNIIEAVEKPKYKIGDWVECVAKQGQRKLVDYLGGMECYKTNYGEVISPGEILRKLSPSDVVIHIGCLSGTVCNSDDTGVADTHFYLHTPGTEDDTDIDTWCLIALAMLDTPTRELVQSLLKAQEKEE